MIKSAPLDSDHQQRRVGDGIMDVTIFLAPAHSTKLIFFRLQSNDGYILDQWTGNSVSIPFEPCFIAFDHSGYVARKN
jgi:hypothetical protein